MRTVAAVVSVFAAGCASGRAVDPSAPTQKVVFSSSETPTIMTDRALAVALDVNKPVAAARAAVKQVYAELEVPLTIDNTATRQLGNGDFYKSRQFPGQAMANLLNCGSGMTGPNANSFRIYMSLVSVVSDNGKGGSTVSTTLSASARDMAGGTGSTSRLPCGSTGALEKVFNDKVTAAAR